MAMKYFWQHKFSKESAFCWDGWYSLNLEQRLVSKLVNIYNNQESAQGEGNCKKILKLHCLHDINLYILLYIVGAFMLMTFLPLVFLLSLTTPVSILVFAMLAKTGSGFMIISQMTIIPKLTLNRSRRVAFLLYLEKISIKNYAIWACRYILFIIYNDFCVNLCYLYLEIFYWGLHFHSYWWDLLFTLCLQN